MFCNVGRCLIKIKHFTYHFIVLNLLVEMLDRLHASLTLLGARTRTDFFIRAKFFAHVVSLSTSKVSPGFANTDKLKMNDSSHNYKESDEYLEDASDAEERVC